MSEWQETSKKERSERRQVIKTIGVGWSEKRILLKLVRSCMIVSNLRISLEISVYPGGGRSSWELHFADQNR